MDGRLNVFLSPISLNQSVINFILCGLFFFSGCAALIYQVMWQRALYSIFGTDLHSTTITISIFMFGLGLGGSLGGYLADKARPHLLTLYMMIEFFVAIFGFYSYSLIERVGEHFFSASRVSMFIIIFILLSLPTILMGATFPILVTHVNKFKKNIGDSVGSLYFANTIGGAVGAYFAGFILLYSLDLPNVINHAALINLITAFVALMFFRK